MEYGIWNVECGIWNMEYGMHTAQKLLKIRLQKLLHLYSIFMFYILYRRRTKLGTLFIFKN